MTRIPYNFTIGRGKMRIKLTLLASSAADAQGKLVSFLNSAQIIEAFAGNEDSKDGPAKTLYPELRGRMLFEQPRKIAPFADAPALIAEDEPEMIPTAVEVITK